MMVVRLSAYQLTVNCKPGHFTLSYNRAGTIRGRLIDEQSNPVANAWVRAEYQRRAPQSRLDNLGREAQGVGLSRVLTDEDGRFQLERLAKSAVYDLHAEKHHGGYAEQRDVREGSNVSLKLPSPAQARRASRRETDGRRMT